MKLFALIALLVVYPVLAAGQARTAERIVSVNHSQLASSGNPPNGEVRYVINGMEGTTPCMAGGTGAFAYRTGGVWSCPKLTPGVGTGDLVGPSASSVGEMVLFNSTNGKLAGRSNSLNGIPFLTNGVVSALGSTGTGSVVRDNTATLTAPTLLTPIIGSFAAAQHTHASSAGGGQLNASTVFSTGTVPPERVISGAVTNSRCLRVSNVGQIEVAASDCGAGGGGSPGGVSGNLTFNEAGSFGGLSNTAYDAATGRLTVSQKANGNDTLNLQRFTDSGPTGNLLRARNAANSVDLFRLGVDGVVAISNTIISTNVAAPSTPATGTTVLWTDSSGKNLRAQDDAGNVSVTVRAVSCSGTDKLSAISAAGVPTCTADQGGAGTGVITLNTLTTSDQSFADVDDTNVTLAISSSVSTHTFTLGWTGALAKGRQNAATWYADQSNTATTGTHSFAAATSLIVASGAGFSPTASGSLGYDTTSNTWEGGVNGTNRTFAFTTGSQTFSDKTLDNSTTASFRDTLFTLQDNTDSTKTVNFELGGITTGTNRVVTIANAASVTVQPTTATTNQFVTHIDSAGVVQKAQPSFSQLSGSILATQGGTNQTSVVQGDMLYSDATNSWARLPKSTAATRVLTNTGSSNNPAWAQVDLTNAVTGVLPPANWSVLTTKGDLLVHNGTTSVRQAVGTNGFALLADSTQTNGVRWGAITASAGGSNTELQRNNSGVLAGITGATSDGTAVTFSAGNIIVGSAASAPTPSLGRLYVDSADGRLYFGLDGSNWGELFVAGRSMVNLSLHGSDPTADNVTGTLPLAGGGTNQTSWTASRCVQVNSAGTALESAAAACGSGGGGTPGGSDTQVQFNDGGSFGGDAGLTYAKSTDTLTIAGALVLSATGAGYVEMAEGSAPSAVANRLTITAPSDAPAGGLVYVLPADTPSNGEQLTANISGTVVTLSWDAAGSGGSGDAVSVNGSDATDANFINTAASGTVPSITWALNTGATPDEVSISAIGAASGTEAGVITTGTQSIAGTKTFTGTVLVGHTTALGRLGQLLEVTTSANLGGMAFNTFSTTVSEAALIDFNRSKSATKGTHTAVTSGDLLGLVTFRGSDGTSFQDAAQITGEVDGAVSASDMPGRITFRTTSDGAAATTERWRINNAGHFLAATDNTYDIGAVAGTRPRNVYVATEIQSPLLTATGSGAGYLEIAEGSAPALVANRFQIVAPADVAAGGLAYILPGTAASGAMRVTNSSGTMTITHDAGISHLASSSSADLRGTLSDESGTGAALFAGGDIGAGTATTPSANDNDTSIATTAYVQAELTAFPSDTATLTNKIYDTEATGNAFTSTGKAFIVAGGCQGTTAFSNWDLPASTPAAAACVTGTVVIKGVLDFADTSGGFSAQNTIKLPGDFTGTIDAQIQWTTTATSGNVKWSLSTICTATDGTETDDPGAFNTASTVTTAAPGVASRVQTSSITSLTITGCAANELLHLRIFRDGNDAADTIAATARLVGVELTIRRAQ